MKSVYKMIHAISIVLVAQCSAVAVANSEKNSSPEPSLISGERVAQVREEASNACHEGLGRHKDRKSKFAACKEAVEKISEVASVELYGHGITIEFKDPKRFMHIRIYLTTNADGTKRIGPAGTGTPQ